MPLHRVPKARTQKVILMADEAVFHIGIKALVLNSKNEILLLKAGIKETMHTKVDFWDMPGGRIKPGQGIADTLLREINEELGCSGTNVKIGEIFDASISNFKKSHGHDVSLMLITYLCSLNKRAEFKLSEEHIEWKWTPISKAKELLKVKYPHSFIEHLDALQK